MTTEENRAHHVHHATLQKQLHLRAVLLFGLAYMTPIIVLGIFGVIAVKSNGASAGSYLLATVAMLFTALSYGLMAKHFPVAGSAYTYVRKSLDSRLGFVVGWAILLDYLFLPLVIWLIGGAYLQGQFPGVPFWVWIVAYIVLTSALNVIGLKVADRTNFVLMTVQLLILLFFVILSITHLVSGSQSLVSVTPFVGGGGFSAIAAGAAVAAYSFLGFDAISTLTEETYDAERTIPKAIVLVAFIGGAIFIVVTYFVTLVSPGGTFDNADSLAADIAKTIGSSLFGAVFLTGLIVGQFTSVPGGSGRRRSVAVCNGSRQCVAETPLRLGVRAVPHPGVQHRPGRNHRAHGDFPRCRHIDIVHQRRCVHRVHVGQSLGDRVLPEASRRPAQPLALHPVARHRRDHRHLPADPARLEGVDPRAQLARYRHRLPAGAYPRPHPRTAGDDSYRRSRIALQFSCCR